MHDVINEDARRLENVAVLDRFSRRRYGTSISADDVVETLHAGRGETDAARGRLSGDCAPGANAPAARG